MVDLSDAKPVGWAEVDYQCARCGSSVSTEECESCGGEGVDGHDCGEDSCCCLDPAPNQPCGICGGGGHWFVCLSDPAWCEAHPLPGREDVKRGTFEKYEIRRAAPAGGKEG